MHFDEFFLYRPWLIYLILYLNEMKIWLDLIAALYLFIIIIIASLILQHCQI